MIRYGSVDDVQACQRLAKTFNRASEKYPLGFVRSCSLIGAVGKRELIVAITGDRLCGFIEFHHRRDGISTIHVIAVDKIYQRQGIARSMLSLVPKPIQLKCPVDLPSNGFYSHLGFALLEVEPGRRRALNVWRLD